MEKLKTCLIIDSYSVDLWKSNIISDLLSLEICSIEYFILLSENNNKGSQKNFSIKEQYKKFDYKLFKEKTNSLQKVNVEEKISDFKIFNYTVSEDKITLNSDDLEKISAAKIDLCINLSEGGKIDAKISEIYTHGIWEFKAIDDVGNLFEGELGINEFYSRNPVCGFALIQRKNEVKQVLSKGYSRTNPISLYKTKNRVLLRSSTFVADNLRLLHSLGEEDYLKKVSENYYFNYSEKKWYPKGVLLFIKVGIRIANHLFSSKFVKEQWQLIYAEKSEKTLKNFKKLVPPKNNEWADPFIIKEGNETYIFFESISKESFGSISVNTLSNFKLGIAPKEILKLDYHLSYPFVFKYKDNYYMIPETKQNNDIELFECLEFPYKWKKKHVIIENVEAVDTSLFYYNEKWWMFTNMARVKGASASEELHIFYANTPLSQNWTPLLSNPQVSDIRSSRNGGKIISKNGKHYRVSQDCSISYGYSVSFHEILELNENSYREKRVNSILPDWDKKVKAIHTVVNEGDIWVMDVRIRG